MDLWDLYEKKFRAYRFQAQVIRVHHKNTTWEYENPEYFARGDDSFFIVPQEEKFDQVEFFNFDSVEIKFEEDDS